MWGVRHQKISCNCTQNNKCEGGQGEAGTRTRFIIVSIEEEVENNGNDIMMFMKTKTKMLMMIMAAAAVTTTIRRITTLNSTHAKSIEGLIPSNVARTVDSYIG